MRDSLIGAVHIWWLSPTHLGVRQLGALEPDWWLTAAMASVGRNLLRATEHVVRAVNEEHGTTLSLIGRLPGGFQEGAYELQAGRRRVVVKWNSRPTPLARLAEAAQLVAAARAARWPTPEWLHYGVAPSGARYVVQDYVDGRHREELDTDTLDLLLEVNQLQAGLDLHTQQEWSRYAKDVVFDNREGFPERVVSFSREGQELRSVIDGLCAEAAGIEVPDDDLVCGVFALENTLFDENAVAGVIDVGAMGRGCRAFDLAVLYSRLPADCAGSVVEQQLRAAAESVAGAAVFRECLVAEILGVLSFGVDHWPGNVPRATRRWTEQLRALM